MKKSVDKETLMFDMKTNPYQLIWYRKGWSERKIQKNNAKYWEWEIENNGLTIP